MIKFLAIASFVAFSTPALAQDANTQAMPAATPQAMGKIIMYRQGALMGMGLGCPFRYKGKEIVELGRNKYAEWPVPAGSYILTNKTSSVDVNVNPGQTKYVRCVIKTGMLTGRADLQIVDAETYNEHSADYERKEIAAPDMVSAQ
ncbi:hypothetical protein [Sphingobium sp. UBA5915]|uniref:hypothetical protein n=1 Tax=Sphingobium sp. UBA5915 TaxID=1947530 RepID=UPI0025E3C568|nr:hypothetical protein [Sphingobium sp. UBA5915]